MKQNPIRILLVEDDEDDYVIIQDVISEIKYMQIELIWVDNYGSALETAKNGSFDIFIIDYFLRGFTGLDLLHEFRKNGLRKPAIVLTGLGDHGIDLQAMEAGASDYIEKDKITPPLLEKTIRYAIAQSETLEVLKESEKRLRMLSAKLINAQESERKRIAKELHDSIGSNLAAIKFEIQKQLMSGSGDTASLSADPCFKNLNDLLNATIEETRRICMSLRPAVLDDLGIIIAIQWFCRKFCEIYTHIDIRTDLKVDEKEIPDPIKIVIYRVIQEALTNVVKHSNATIAHILFEKQQDNIFLNITDNGCGFDTNAKRIASGSGGIGLSSMAERVSSSGGSLSISSDGKTRTEIRAVWPGVLSV